MNEQHTERCKRFHKRFVAAESKTKKLTFSRVRPGLH